MGILFNSGEIAGFEIFRESYSVYGIDWRSLQEYDEVRAYYVRVMTGG